MLSNFVETLPHFYQIPYPKNVNVWTKLDNFLLNKIFVGILTLFFESHLKINEIDETFDLVLLTEKYNESIILLKDLLCWDYNDLRGLTLNVHKRTKSKIS